MLKRLKLGQKLIGCFVLVALLAVFVGGMGIYGMTQIQSTSEEMADIRIPSIISLNAISENMTGIQRGERSAIMAIQNFDMDSYNQQVEQLKNLWGEIEANWKKYEAIPKSDKEQKLWTAVIEKKKSWKVDHDKIMELISQAALDEAATYSLTMANQAYLETDKLIKELVQVQNELTDADVAAAGSKYSTIRTLLWFVIFGAVAVAIAIGMLLTLSITKPIARVVDLAQHIADYDLTSEKIQVKSEDEVGLLAEALNKMAARLTEMVSVINGNTNELVVAAKQISTSSAELSDGVKEQTNQTAQVSTAVEEMSATILEATKNTSEAAETAKIAADKSKEGSRLAEDTSRGMEEIVESSNVTSHNIQGLAEKAMAIGEIIKVIDDIADQTNLLALNAAIEAARAGEQGRGFAVVADEVRKLAERTTKATKEVAETIKGIQLDVSRANEQINESKQTVDKGKELVQNTNASLTEIFNAIEIVQEMMRQLATASEQQSAAAEEISKSVENVDTITKESAVGAEQSAAASERLNKQAEELRKLVGAFKLRKQTTAGVQS